MNKVQLGEVHPVVFVHRQLPLLHPGEEVYHPSVEAGDHGGAPGDDKEVKIPVRVLGQGVQQLLVYAVGHMEAVQ